MQKSNKYDFAFCAAGYAREKGTFGASFNLKYFVVTAKFRWLTESCCGPQFSVILL
jgi:hypothetical protein